MSLWDTKLSNIQNTNFIQIPSTPYSAMRIALICILCQIETEFIEINSLNDTPAFFTSSCYVFWF